MAVRARVKDDPQQMDLFCGGAVRAEPPVALSLPEREATLDETTTLEAPAKASTGQPLPTEPLPPRLVVLPERCAKRRRCAIRATTASRMTTGLGLVH